MTRLAQISRLVLVALVLGGAARAEAQAAGRDPRPAAVGLLELPGGRGSCTATLIAPDLVLTAAHCLLGRDDRDRPFPARAYVFRPTAGPARGFRARQRAVHPSYTLLPSASPMRSARDLGLLRLARPVPADLAKPLTVAPDRPLPQSVWLLSRHTGQAGAKARRCPVLRPGRGMAALGCAVVPGDSGAAVLNGPLARPTLLGVVSSRATAGARSVALIGLVAGHLDLLAAVLNTRAAP